MELKAEAQAQAEEKHLSAFPPFFNLTHSKQTQTVREREQ